VAASGQVPVAAVTPDGILPLNVPPHMRQSLFDWLSEACSQCLAEGIWPMLCQMLHIDYAGNYPTQAAIDAANKDSDLLLALIDGRLKLGRTYNLNEDLTPLAGRPLGRICVLRSRLASDCGGR
jgi:hypothetical protein